MQLLFSEKMSQTYISILLFSLVFLFGAAIEDRCSKHYGLSYVLVECPSSETFNLLECYDSHYKDFWSDFLLTKYWCWSRGDVDEKVIKNVTISTARVENDDLIAKLNQPFSTQFTFNGTHYKCDTMEKWATESIDVNNFPFGASLPCVTSTVSFAEILYCNPLEICFGGL